MEEKIRNTWHRAIELCKKIELVFLGVAICCFVAMFLFDIKSNESSMNMDNKYFYAFVGGLEFVFYGALYLFYSSAVRKIRKLHFSYSKIYRFVVAYIIYFSFLGSMGIANILLSMILGDKRFLLFFAFFFIMYYLNRPVNSRLLHSLNLSSEERVKLM